MISLTDLRARQVVPAWQEAVAVVQELLYAVTQTQGPSAQLPDVDHIALIANGDVVELPGSGPTGNPVSYAAGLLKTMLDGAAVPPELRTLVDENAVESPRITTIAEFTRQLAFFERPGRRHDVEQLVARAMSADSQNRAEEELRRLKEKTLVGAADLDVFRTEVPEKKRIAPGRQVVAVAAVLAVVLVAAGAWWLYGWMQRPGSDALEEMVAEQAAPVEPAPVADASSDPHASSEPQASSDPHASPVNGAPQPSGDAAAGATASSASETPQAQQASFFERTRASLRRVVDSAFGTAETAAPEKPGAAEPEPAKEAAARAPTRRRRSAPAASRSAGGASSSAAQTPSAQPPQVSTIVEESVIEPPPQSVGSVSEPQSLVYSRADADVRPAILLRPLLPESPPPDVPPDQIGTLELVVDEYGDVEQVRLISPSNRFHERMLVAHAKSWKFRPAIRDGRPVKYRTVVRLTI